MMLHQDGSSHEWVLGKKWDLIVTMDDATSEHYSMFFVEEEGTDSSFQGARDVILHKEIRITVECPSRRFPEDARIPRPKVEVLSLCLQNADLENPSIFNQIFGVKEELQRENLDLIVKRGIFTEITMGDSTKTDSFSFRCPKLPHDMDARIGVRRNPKNPDRIEKIFGLNAIIDTSIELDLGIELPVACTTIAGNGEEGRHFITNKKQILNHHGKLSMIDLADAKYDETHNYQFARSQGAIPMIDYNPRSENLSPQALKTRGYNQQGRPYAPCGILTHPNGFDQKCQRASFSCRRHCVGSNDPQIRQYAETASTGSTTTASPTICRSTTSPG